MAPKHETPIRLTFESLHAHDYLEKPRSSIQHFTSNSNRDPWGHFTATGNSNRRAFDVERGLKGHQRGYLASGNGNGRVTESATKKSLKKEAKQREVREKEFKRREIKEKELRQKEAQNERDRVYWGRDGGWYRG